MKLSRFLSLLLLLVSCKSFIIEDIDRDPTQYLKGKIQQIEVNSFRYSLIKNDTVVRTTKSVRFFDLNNRIEKQIDYFKKFTEETVYVYKNDLLESTISKSENQVTKIEYIYDERKNVIEYRQLENDTLTFLKTSIFDKRNNTIEATYLHPNHKSINSVEKFDIDYKNRIVKIQSFDEDNKIKNHYLKKHFNKKGFTVKTEFIYTDSNSDRSRSSRMEYDKFGNQLKRLNFDSKGNSTGSTEFKYAYDKNGNIIIQEKYSNEKLIEKITVKITYR